MNNIKFVIAIISICFILQACSSVQSVSVDSTIPIYAWNRGFKNPSQEVLQARFIDLKNKGVTGLSLIHI